MSEQEVIKAYSDRKTLTLDKSDVDKLDMVNHPQHYKTGKIECIDCISAIVNMYNGEQAYDVGQVIKYLYRAPTKMYRPEYSIERLGFRPILYLKIIFVAIISIIYN